MFISRFSKWALGIAYLILCGWLVSCGEGTTPGSNFIDPELTRTQWILATINDKPAADGIQAMLAFDESNNIFGSTGCNLYAGTYVIGEGNDLSFKPRVTTSWECEEPYFAQEAAILLVLSSTSEYALEGDELKITNPEGNRRGTFTKTEQLGLDGTSWILEIFKDGQGVLVNLIEGTQITAAFDRDGNLSGFGGCNEYNATLNTYANNISFGPIITTQMTCPEPEGVMDQESQYFTAIEQAKTYRNYGIALEIFDVEGGLLASYLSPEITSQR